MLLRRLFRIGWRLRLRQKLDGRPQFIDQAVAVADLPPFLNTGQCIPQRQKPFATKCGGVQLLLRCDNDFALVNYRWRLAAESDSVIADDIGAHGVAPVSCDSVAAGHPTSALLGD
jgi:hypothetical protein